MSYTVKTSSAWLVRWVWMKASAALEDTIAAIIRGSRGTEYVMRFVEDLYALQWSCVSELVARVRGRRATAEVHFGELITVGSDPWLEAQKVRDLSVEVDESTRIETVRWTVPPRYKSDGMKPVPITKPVRMEIVRSASGPLRHERLHPLPWTPENRKPRSVRRPRGR